MPDSVIPKLIEFFERLPGIGPRQAKRFVYALADESPDFLEKFSALVSRFSREVSRCPECFRIFEGNGGGACGICRSSSRDDDKVLVLEKDADLENLEKNQVFSGRYHILGGLISPLKPESQSKIRFRELYNRLEKNNKIQEIILALSPTTEGEMTRRYIEKILEPLVKKRKIKISNLGRGLSTGSDLEYSDRDTLKHAFDNRK